jgi:CheY-like chemotaxis protein
MTDAARTILIVDDEFSIAETLGEILTWEGYAVVLAPNGQAGLTEIERAMPSLVLLDFMMPVMDGLALLRIIRSRAELQHLPVILMTAARLAVPPTERQFDALLRKPFEVDAVLKLVQTLLDTGRSPAPAGGSGAGPG